MNWIKEMFGVEKPIIALLHLRALPGDPLYSKDDTMENVVKIAREELFALQEGGVDGILFANEFSLPHEKKVSYVTVAAMARIIGELKKDIILPFGVNISSNSIATIDLAAATGADFARNSFTGAYIGENGIKDTDIATTLRRKRALGLDNLRLLFKVNPESEVYIGERSIEKITKSIIFRCFPDGLCVSGDNAGTETNSDLLDRVKNVSGDVPVFCNTGCTAENIVEKLKTSDGACVGTAFKTDGKFENYVDETRVKIFMDNVKTYRSLLKG
jgi:uncharacterized protein